MLLWRTLGPGNPLSLSSREASRTSSFDQAAGRAHHAPIHPTRARAEDTFCACPPAPLSAPPSHSLTSLSLSPPCTPEVQPPPATSPTPIHHKQWYCIQQNLPCTKLGFSRWSNADNFMESATTLTVCPPSSRHTRTQDRIGADQIEPGIWRPAVKSVAARLQIPTAGSSCSRRYRRHVRAIAFVVV